MNYTVVWSPPAEREMANLWLNASDRESLAKIFDEIDSRLRRNPLSQGESRDNDQRILILIPIAATFSVNQGDRLVQVLHVWKFS